MIACNYFNNNIFRLSSNKLEKVSKFGLLTNVPAARFKTVPIPSEGPFL